MSTPENGALVPLGTGDNLPNPTELKRQLTEAMENHVARIREERGPVTGPEDTFDLIRRLTSVRERMGDYQRAFGQVANTSKDFIEEELFEAVDEQDGVPTSNLRVPTAGGDISISRDLQNQYDIDMGQVVAVLTARLSAAWISADANPAERPEEFAIDVAMEALTFMGAGKPKVTSVRTLATELSRAGNDQLAKAASDAITKRVKYKGIKVDREAS